MVCMIPIFCTHRLFFEASTSNNGILSVIPFSDLFGVVHELTEPMYLSIRLCLCLRSCLGHHAFVFLFEAM